MMKLAKKTITAESRWEATGQLAESFLRFYSLGDSNVKTEIRDGGGGGVMEFWSDALKKSRMTN